MKKEVIYAIVAGGILGLLIAFGAWRVNSALSPKEKETPKVQNNIIKNSTNISIASPNNLDVLVKSPTTISGLAKVASLVVISSDEEDVLVRSDNEGSFSGEIELSGGVNNINVGIFNDKGDYEKQSIKVVYSTEFAKITPPEIPTDNPTSSDSVRQKVQDKLKDAYNNPLAYMGTITDISENGIQIKTSEGEIEQISTTESPTVIQDGKNAKEVKLTDIAIGDYVVAMGFTGNHVLTAKRILITTEKQMNTAAYLSGKVEKATSKDITVKNDKDESSVLALSQSTTSTYLLEGDKLSKVNFSNISVDDKVYLIGKIENEKFLPRTIFIIGRP